MIPEHDELPAIKLAEELTALIEHPYVKRVLDSYAADALAQMKHGKSRDDREDARARLLAVEHLVLSIKAAKDTAAVAAKQRAERDARTNWLRACR